MTIAELGHQMCRVSAGPDQAMAVTGQCRKKAGNRKHGRIAVTLTSSQAVDNMISTAITE